MHRIVGVLLFAGCASTPTGSVCPSTDPPTYDNFGRQFMATYCTGCHSANASNRHGAPSSQNFDTEVEIVSHAQAIDLEAASGPNATNTSMPALDGPVHVAPTAEERARLGQYLACMRR